MWNLRLVSLSIAALVLAACAQMPMPRQAPATKDDYQVIWRQIDDYTSQALKSARDTVRVASLIRAEHENWIGPVVDGAEANLRVARESQVSDLGFVRRADFTAASRLVSIPLDAATVRNPAINIFVTPPKELSSPDVSVLAGYSRRLAAVGMETAKIERARVEAYRVQQRQQAEQAKVREAAARQEKLAEMVRNSEGRTRKDSEAFCRTLDGSSSEGGGPSTRDMCGAMIGEVEEPAKSVAKIASVALRGGGYYEFLGELGRMFDALGNSVAIAAALAAGDQAAVIDSFTKTGDCTLNSHGTHECQYVMTIRYVAQPSLKIYGMTNPIGRPVVAGFRKSASGIWQRAPTSAEMAAIEATVASAARSSGSSSYRADIVDDWKTRKANQSACTTSKLILDGSSLMNAMAYCGSRY